MKPETEMITLVVTDAVTGEIVEEASTPDVEYWREHPEGEEMALEYQGLERKVLVRPKLSELPALAPLAKRD